MSLPVALTQGTVIGSHYIIGDLINSGGFGAVYRGIDTSEGNRPCAIKETYNVTPAARRQALMEASVLFTVRSEHLPEVYDALEVNGRFYLVMQLIEGQNLLQILHARVPSGLVGESKPHSQLSGPCSESEVLAWLLPIVDILQELHSRHPPIIHRDIKPGNIILTPQQTAVLVDFGLTKLYDPVETTRTMIKAVSEGFSPVEQYVGKTCPQSDVYAMAATMYLLLTNRLPPASLSRTMRDDLIAPRLLSPAISTKMERVLLKALAINANDRYQSMREFAEALREPAFNSYGDVTVASPLPMQTAPVMGYVMPNPSSGSSYANPPVPPPYANGSPYQQLSPTKPGTSYQAPPPPYVNQPHNGSKGNPASKMAPPMQKPVSPAKQKPVRPVRPLGKLPDPASQGCLWGVLQGILGALVVLSVDSSGFFLSTLLALLFYAIAGFMTTRRGGGIFRGGRAGYHTCLTGTLFFWLSLGIGLILKLLNANSTTYPDMRRHSIEAASIAWKSIQPSWSDLRIMPEQPILVNGVVWIAGGIALAWVLGWVGGWLGSARFQSKMVPGQ